MLPWGTPLFVMEFVEAALRNCTSYCVLYKYDFIQLKAIPRMP